MNVGLKALFKLCFCLAVLLLTQSKANIYIRITNKSERTKQGKFDGFLLFAEVKVRRSFFFSTVFVIKSKSESFIFIFFVAASFETKHFCRLIWLEKCYALSKNILLSNNYKVYFRLKYTFIATRVWPNAIVFPLQPLVNSVFSIKFTKAKQLWFFFAFNLYENNVKIICYWFNTY